MVGGLGQGDDVEGPVQLAITAAVETQPLGLARAGRDGSDASESRQGVGRPEAADVADLADEPGGDQRTGPRQAEERVALDQRRDPRRERPLPEAERPELGQPAAGELGLDAGLRPEEPPDQPLVTEGDEVGGPGTVPGQEAAEVGVETVADPGHLDDDVLAGLDEELQVEGVVGHADRWQVGLASRHPGDREGVAGIALAEPAGRRPFATGELGRDLADGQLGRDEEAGGGRPEARRALDPDDRGRVGLVDPGQQPAVAGGSLSNVPSAVAEPRSSTQQAASVALWVSMPIAPMPILRICGYDGSGSGGQQCVEVKVHAPMRPRLARSSSGRGHLNPEASTDAAPIS
jgi:hypothetical protein